MTRYDTTLNSATGKKMKELVNNNFDMAIGKAHPHLLFSNSYVIHNDRVDNLGLIANGTMVTNN